MDWEPLYEGVGAKCVFRSDERFRRRRFLILLPDDLTLYADAKDTFEKSTQHYQYKGKYIMTAVKSGLMIIDQHRAHIRVLYDRYRNKWRVATDNLRGCFFLKCYSLPPSEGIVLEHLTDDLHALGFDLSVLGGGSFSINAIPSGTEGLNPVEVVRGIVHSSIEKGCNVEEDVRHYICFVGWPVARPLCKQVLSNEEMEALVDDLFVCRNPNQTPDGKVVVAILEQDDLDQLFG